MTAALKNYHARMQRVLEHIDQHLDGELNLEALSDVAAFSKYHFHRQFTALFGLSLHRYIQLARMKRASYQLAFRDAISVTEIAMDAGYEAPDAFARAFRQRFGQSPQVFRKSPDWEPWLAAFGPFDNARRKRMQKTYTAQDVTVRDLPPTTVAIMSHHGDPATLGTTIQRFIAWRKSVGLNPKISATFNIFHSDPRTTPPAEFRLDFCASTDRPVEPNGEGVRSGAIPGGRCAVLRVVGEVDDLEPAALYLYRDWLPSSGEELGDFPLYCQHITLFPDASAHEVVKELFLLLK
jgi:AraC family transcriptional regulator